MVYGSAPDGLRVTVSQISVGVAVASALTAVMVAVFVMYEVYVSGP